MNTKNEITPKDLKVLVLGDSLLDRYWAGWVRGISAEAPIPIVTGVQKIELPGGAANVARALKALGVGKVTELYGLGTPIKNRLMVDDHQVARWDEQDQCRTILPHEAALAMYAGPDAIVVADYGKGSIDREVVETLKANHPIPIFVDSKGDPSVWRDASSSVFLFPNLKEYDKYPEAFDQAPIVILKEGPAGISLRMYGEEVYRYPALAKQVVSVNGAGDTVLAAMCVQYLLNIRTHTKRDCLEVASAAAAIVVGKPYTATVTFEEINEFIGNVARVAA